MAKKDKRMVPLDLATMVCLLVVACVVMFSSSLTLTSVAIGCSLVGIIIGMGVQKVIG